MKYRANVPLLSMSAFEIVVDAADEKEATQLAREFFFEWRRTEPPPGSIVKLKREDDEAVVEFVRFDQDRDSWLGDDIDVEPVQDEDIVDAILG